jgi:hypothetical protein
MTDHSKREIETIHSVASGTGGNLLVIMGTNDETKLYYRGMRQPPERTLLKAALTFLASDTYEEIIIFTGGGAHLPRLEVGPVIRDITLFPGAWYLRGQKEESKPAEEEKPADDPFMPKIKKHEATKQELFDARERKWRERLVKLIEEIDHRCGKVWQSGKYVNKAPYQKRSLIVVDSPYIGSFTRPDTAIEFNLIQDRFSDIGKRLNGTSVDVVFLCSSHGEAQQLLGGGFLGDEYPDFKLNGAKIVSWPIVEREGPFGIHIMGSDKNKRLYDNLRRKLVKAPDDPLTELKSMYGMDKVGYQVNTIITRIVSDYNKIKLGFPSNDYYHNIIITGPAGTGKSTVARIVARIFSEQGVCGSKYSAVKPDDFFTGYVRQTGKRTAEICQAALGGILFIDEAYEIVKGEGNTTDFGSEAITTLMGWMDDHKKDLAVFIAGYEDEIKTLLRSNKGLVRRFPYRINLRAYTNEELVEIAHSIARKRGLEIIREANEIIGKKIDDFRKKCDQGGVFFGNAGDVENLLEGAISQQAMRFSHLGIKNPTFEDYRVLQKEDFENAVLDLPGEE